MSVDYATVAEANRRFYARVADLYDTTESCVIDPLAQRDLESDLGYLLGLLNRPAGEIRALDACGGSGNVSLKLLRRGGHVTVADISQQLLEVLKRKCEANGYAPEIHCGEIGKFLQETDRVFDLITFSSALHHLQDIESVLRLACRRLAPGGLLFTCHDPTSRARHKGLTRLALQMEYYAFKMF